MSDSERLEKGQRMMQQLEGGAAKSEVSRMMEEMFPDFWTMTQEHLYGDIWSGSVLSLRDRIIATLAVLIVLVCSEELKVHMRYALNNGISREEILEIINHVKHYGGWPTGVNALFAAKDVFPPRE